MIIRRSIGTVDDNDNNTEHGHEGDMGDDDNENDK